MAHVLLHSSFFFSQEIMSENYFCEKRRSCFTARFTQKVFGINCAIQTVSMAKPDQNKICEDT